MTNYYMIFVQDGYWFLPGRAFPRKIFTQTPCVRESGMYNFYLDTDNYLLMHVFFNPFPHDSEFQLPWRWGSRKTLWEKEKMLETSIFSFSHNIFYPIKDKISSFLDHFHSIAFKNFYYFQVWTLYFLGWLVVLGFNATLTAKVISWRSVMHMCFLAFSHQY